MNVYSSANDFLWFWSFGICASLVGAGLIAVVGLALRLRALLVTQPDREAAFRMRGASVMGQGA